MRIPRKTIALAAAFATTALALPSEASAASVSCTGTGYCSTSPFAVRAHSTGHYIDVTGTGKSYVVWDAVNGVIINRGSYPSQVCFRKRLSKVYSYYMGSISGTGRVSLVLSN